MESWEKERAKERKSATAGPVPVATDIGPSHARAPPGTFLQTQKKTPVSSRVGVGAEDMPPAVSPPPDPPRPSATPGLARASWRGVWTHCCNGLPFPPALYANPPRPYLEFSVGWLLAGVEFPM